MAFGFDINISKWSHDSLTIQLTDILDQFPTFINCLNCESKISVIINENKWLVIKNASKLTLLI
ncbi:hypothetical protein [Spiroplasma endosymbiont of Polydrusus pterygomalis]|uniref:hypothetical protein n=1 Tax=Spiroplasma endosymbiont of Polydrusus pterygomalis TaxID=3139327 RepID=UPI003CCAC4D1